MSGIVTGSKLGITIAAMAGALMAVIDITIVMVALTEIRASLGTPLDQIAWVSTSYMMANIVVIPMTGWLQKRFGYRAYFSGSVLLFTAASCLCGMSWNLPSLIVFRILQGIGGGAIIPTAQSLLFARYPQKEHGMAGGLFGLGAVMGPLLGPTVGGYLIEYLSWHWIFLINIPFGLLTATLAWKYIEEPGYKPARDPIDVYGIGLMAVGLASLQYVLEEGNRLGWLESHEILVFGTLALIALVTFLVHELETPHPVVNLKVFADFSYAAATGINCMVGMALFAGSFLFSLYCGVVMRYQALDIGLVFLRGSFILLILMPLVGSFGGKIDGRFLLIFGCLMMCASLWLNGHLTPQADSWTMTMPIFVRSLGLAFIFIPLNMLALSHLSPAQRGNATGLFNLMRELGGSIGTAWMSNQLDRNTHHYLVSLGQNIDALGQTAHEQFTQSRFGVAHSLWDSYSGALQLLQMRVNSQALVRAFNDSFLRLLALFVVGMLLILWLKPPEPGAHQGGGH